MRPGTSHSGHRSPGRRTAPSASRVALLCPGASANTGAGPRSVRPRPAWDGLADSPLQTSARCLCARCVSSRALNFQPSTLNSGVSAANSPQTLCFHPLPHSSITAQKPPLCFHILTNTFSRSSFVFKFIRKQGGCHPQFANSSPANNTEMQEKPRNGYNDCFTPKATWHTGLGSYWVRYAGVGPPSVLADSPRGTRECKNEARKSSFAF